LPGQTTKLLSGADAMDFALLAFRQPGFQFDPESFVAFPDVLSVLKAAAGDSETLDHLSIFKNAMPEQLQTAAQFCLRHVIAASIRDPHQALILKSWAEEQNIRDHKRWLLKWLHPDRNPNKWETNLFSIVNGAASQLLGADTSMAASRTALNGGDTPWKHAMQRRRIVEPSTTRRRAVKLVGFFILVLTALLCLLMFVASDNGLLQQFVWVPS
jgi:hypothetical protein